MFFWNVVIETFIFFIFIYIWKVQGVPSLSQAPRERGNLNIFMVIVTSNIGGFLQISFAARVVSC